MASEWYVTRGEKRSGPFSSSQLKGLVGQQKLRPTDLVWREGMESPIPAISVKGLIHNSITPHDLPSEGSTSASRMPEDPSETGSGENLSFVSYVWHSYQSMHGPLPVVVGICVAAVLAPLLSFLKPRIGATSMVWIAGVSVAVSSLLFLLISFLAALRFAFSRKRSIPDDVYSWGPTCTCFLFTLSGPLVVLAIAESFGPKEGFVATLIPEFKKEQERLLEGADLAGVESVPPLESQNESSLLESKSVKISSIERASENDITEDSSASQNVSDAPERANSLSVDGNTESTVDGQIEKRLAQQSGELSKSSPVAEDIANESEMATDSDSSLEVEDIAPKETGQISSTLIQEISPGESSPTTRVIAEGSGVTPGEALKDAFRNAVRQVVGAIVDAESLVKNDELIDDNVLTYSDGFIKGYEEVVGSKKESGGLHRIKIDALVEKRNVIAKLKSANIIVAEVDGKGLFAEAITKIEAEKDSVVLLKKQFEGFPQSLLTAKIVDKPEVIEKSDSQVTLRLRGQIEVDSKAFKAFSERLTLILDKLAEPKRDFTVKFFPGRIQTAGGESVSVMSAKEDTDDSLQAFFPFAFETVGGRYKNELFFSVATGYTNSRNSIDFKSYLMEPALRSVLSDIASRSGRISVALLDSTGQTVITNRVDTTMTPITVFRRDNFEGDLRLAELKTSGNEYEYKQLRELSVFFLCSPTFLKSRYGKMPLYHTQSPNFQCDFHLGLDELKNVKDSKVEIAYDE